METGFFDRFQQKFKNIDIYGEQISLYYRGEKSFKTKLGACLTLLSGIIILIYMGVQMRSVFERDYDLQIEQRLINEYEHATSYNVTTSNIDFAFQYDFNYTKMPRFWDQPWKYILTQATFISEGENEDDTYEIVLNVSKCGDDRFTEVEYLPSRLSTDLFYCFDIDNYIVQGTYDGSLMTYYALKFLRCSQSELDYMGINGTCADEEDIDYVISNSRLKFMFIEQQFDEEEFEEPVDLLARVQYFTYKMDLLVQQDVLINKNDLTLQDSWLYSGLQNTLVTYYALALSQVQVGSKVSDSVPFFQLNLRKGFQEQVITRTRDNFMDLLSDLGGISNIIYVVFLYIASSYSENSYFESVMSQLFKYQKDMLKTEVKLFRDEKTELQGPKEHLYNRLLKSVINRAPVKLNLFQSYQKWLFCRKQNQNKHFYQKQLALQIEKFFSIDTMIKRMREVSVLTSLILNKQQRTLIPYLFQNMVLTNPKTLQRQSEAVKTYLKDVLDMNDMAQANQEEIATSLEYVVKNEREWLNTFLLRQLVNPEENDNIEQFIMIDNLEEPQLKGRQSLVSPFSKPFKEVVKMESEREDSINQEYDFDEVIDSPARLQRHYQMGRLKPFSSLANEK